MKTTTSNDTAANILNVRETAHSIRISCVIAVFCVQQMNYRMINLLKRQTTQFKKKDSTKKKIRTELIEPYMQTARA